MDDVVFLKFCNSRFYVIGILGVFICWYLGEEVGRLIRSFFGWDGVVFEFRGVFLLVRSEE